MEETQLPARRMSSWAILLASLLAALLLAVTMVQSLSAQAADDDTAPTPTPEAPGDGNEEPFTQLESSDSLTSTLVVTPELSLTPSGNLTSTLELTPAQAADVAPAIYLPRMSLPLPKIAISGTRPNSGNQWQVLWQSFGSGYSYRLQESQRPDFLGLTLDQTLPGTSKSISHNAAPFNTYYYRVRIEGKGQIGPWSNTLAVTGAYQDDFNDPNTGWAMRRTTFLEQTVGWYGENENAGNYIIVVADRWDWIIASPLQAAPEPPYVIEYRARVHDASNLVSGGVVLGGDWNFDDCPEFGNVYQTDNCFNHFYNFNYIHYGAMKLLFEQIDQLYWCPGCGGSPIKRLGDEDNWRQIDPIFGNGNARDWHTYRIEVRDTGLNLTIDGSYKGEFGTPAYVNDPFFGVFASTDEYKPSIWFYDYFKVTPLDS